MSAKVSRNVSSRGAGPSSQRTKRGMGVDLNAPPSDRPCSAEVGTSSHAPVVPETRARLRRPPPPPVTIDVDSIEDDVVVLSSPRAFVQAKNNPRRSRSRNIVIDVELESANRDAANTRSKRHRVPVNQPVINCESYASPERNGNNVNGRGRNMASQTRTLVAPPPPPPPPPEPVFTCPVCMGPLVEEVSTKCGHIFCKECIKKAVAVQAKCPTCRKKMAMKDTIRIYLPKRS